MEGLGGSAMRVSYRQVGKNKNGRIQKGPPPEISQFAAREATAARVKVRRPLDVVTAHAHTSDATDALTTPTLRTPNATTLTHPLTPPRHPFHIPQRGPASIPSKFETTLHPSARESHAFGNRTIRFSDQDVGCAV